MFDMFIFWLMKSAAEFATGLVILAVLASVYGGLVLWEYLRIRIKEWLK